MEGDEINAKAAALAGKIGNLLDEVEPNLLVALMALLGVAGSVIRQMDDRGDGDDMLPFALGILEGQVECQRADNDVKDTLQ
jgi:hypothetical protein